jgi:hypothetical protein
MGSLMHCLSSSRPPLGLSLSKAMGSLMHCPSSSHPPFGLSLSKAIGSLKHCPFTSHPPFGLSLSKATGSLKHCPFAFRSFNRLTTQGERVVIMYALRQAQGERTGQDERHLCEPALD